MIYALILILVVALAGIGLYFTRRSEERSQREAMKKDLRRASAGSDSNNSRPISTPVSAPSKKSGILKKEYFYVAGVYYHKASVRALAKPNPDWSKSAQMLLDEGKAGVEIYRHVYADRPVKLVPEPTNSYDRNAIKVIVAGEHIGYVPQDESAHFSSVLKSHDVKYLYVRFHGGEVKQVSNLGEVIIGKNEVGARIFIGYV